MGHQAKNQGKPRGYCISLGFLFCQKQTEINSFMSVKCQSTLFLGIKSVKNPSQISQTFNLEEGYKNKLKIIFNKEFVY